jgi:hypothetical protein
MTTAPASIWDDPSLRVGGDYVKFDNIGDTVKGCVIAIGAHRWDDGSVSPQIVLDTEDGEKTVTAGQIRLKVALAEKRPEADDMLTIKLTEIEKRSGGKTLKHFEVTVVKAVKSAGFPAATDSAADALAGLDPAVLEALKAKLGATPF